MTQRNWTKLGGSDDETPIHNFEDEAKVEGKYVSKEEGVGEFNSTLYLFEDEDGEKFKVWGNTLLDNRLSSAIEGDWYQINYLGMAKGKTGRNYKNFEVMHAKNEDEN